MRIERVTDLQEIMRCLPMEREIRKKGRDRSRESEMLLVLQTYINNPLFGFWIVYDDNSDKIHGYGSAYIDPLLKKVHILRIFSDGDEATKMLEDEVLYTWAKAFKCHIMSTTVFKNVKAFGRRFKCKPVSVNMERRL